MRTKQKANTRRSYLSKTRDALLDVSDTFQYVTLKFWVCKPSPQHLDIRHVEPISLCSTSPTYFSHKLNNFSCSSAILLDCQEAAKRIVFRVHQKFSVGSR